MKLNETTRELSSSTGFIKHLETGIIYNYNIYLGNIDSIDNYEEATQDEWDIFSTNIEDLNNPLEKGETNE